MGQNVRKPLQNKWNSFLMENQNSWKLERNQHNLTVSKSSQNRWAWFYSVLYNNKQKYRTNPWGRLIKKHFKTNETHATTHENNDNKTLKLISLLMPLIENLILKWSRTCPNADRENANQDRETLKRGSGNEHGRIQWNKIW